MSTWKNIIMTIILTAITSGQNPWMKHPGLLQNLPNVLKAQGGMLPSLPQSGTPPFQPFLPSIGSPGVPGQPSPTKGPTFDPSTTRRNSMSPIKPDDGDGSSPRSTPIPLPGGITNGSSASSSKGARSEDGMKSPTQTPSPRAVPIIPTSVPTPPTSSANHGSFMSGGRIPKFDPLEGKLQDMLRYNMERYGGQAFDTLATARRVREILSVHNIGQRLFAKYVLGLSQGTVSELLSKPKSWEKLTEKGRDSYRKMHAWVYDEGAVMMLKSLIPRKSELVRSGGGPPGPPGTTPPWTTPTGINGPRDMDRQSPNFDALAKSIMSGDRRFPANPFDFKVRVLQKASKWNLLQSKNHLVLKMCGFFYRKSLTKWMTHLEEICQHRKQNLTLLQLSDPVCSQGESLLVPNKTTISIKQKRQTLVKIVGLFQFWFAHVD